MAKKLAKDLKQGDKVKIFDDVYLIEKIEVSAVGKQGKSKVRIDAVNEKTKEKRIMINLATDEIELA